MIQDILPVANLGPPPKGSTDYEAVRKAAGKTGTKYPDERNFISGKDYEDYLASIGQTVMTLL